MTDHQELALDYLLSISKKIETNPNDNSILLKSHCNEIKQEIKILFQKKNSDPQDQTKLMKLYVELALDYITLGKNLKDAIRLSEKLKIKYPMIVSIKDIKIILTVIYRAATWLDEHSRHEIRSRKP